MALREGCGEGEVKLNEMYKYKSWFLAEEHQQNNMEGGASCFSWGGFLLLFSSLFQVNENLFVKRWRLERDSVPNCARCQKQSLKQKSKHTGCTRVHPVQAQETKIENNN